MAPFDQVFSVVKCEACNWGFGINLSWDRWQEPEEECFPVHGAVEP